MLCVDNSRAQSVSNKKGTIMENVKHWSKRGLNYCVTNQPSNSDFKKGSQKKEIEDIIATACQKWSSVSDFDFYPIFDSDKADIIFQFGSVVTENALGETKYDIKKRNSQVHVVFNDETHWTSINATGASPSIIGPIAVVYGLFVLVKKSIESTFSTNVDLLTITAHEVGHALGLLKHTSSEDSIMRPSISDMSNTFAYYMAGHSVPRVDAETLWDLYRMEPRPFNPPVSPYDAGYVIVGFHQEVTDKTSKAPSRVIHNWGDQGGHQQLVASGYCWNKFMNEPGYGSLYFHLLEADKVELGTKVVVGGHIQYKNKTSKKHTHDGDAWGLCVMDGSCELVSFGELYAWNSNLNADGYAQFMAMIGEVRGDSNYLVSICGGIERLGDASSSSGSRYIKTSWGEPDRGVEHRVCHGRAYSEKYNGAYMQAVIKIPSKPS